MNLRIHDSIQDLVTSAADAVVAAVGSEPCAIALSGGTTPRPLYELLGSGERRAALSGKPITWIVGDERCVAPDDPSSNSAMIESSLFREGLSPGHRFLKFDTTLGSPAEIAAALEHQWKAFGLTRLDVDILGMGDDGHTASLFPGTPVLAVVDRIASEVYVPRLDSWRVTLTLPVHGSARKKFVLAAGGKKRPVLEQVRDKFDYPIVSVVSGEGETWWFIDRAAAPGDRA